MRDLLKPNQLGGDLTHPPSSQKLRGGAFFLLRLLGRLASGHFWAGEEWLHLGNT